MAFTDPRAHCPHCSPMRRRGGELCCDPTAYSATWLQSKIAADYLRCHARELSGVRWIIGLIGGEGFASSPLSRTYIRRKISTPTDRTGIIMYECVVEFLNLTTALTFVVPRSSFFRRGWTEVNGRVFVSAPRKRNPKYNPDRPSYGTQNIMRKKHNPTTDFRNTAPKDLLLPVGTRDVTSLSSFEYIYRIKPVRSES